MKGKEIEAVASLWLLRNLSRVDVAINELGFHLIHWNRRRYTRFICENVAVKLMEYKVRSFLEYEFTETSKQRPWRQWQVFILRVTKTFSEFFYRLLVLTIWSKP